MTRIFYFLLVGLLPVFPVASIATTKATAQLAGVRRIVFLGDSITYAGHYAAAIEAYYVSRFPEREFEFLNLGLASETVSGLSEAGHAGGKFPRPQLGERLGRVLEKSKPDLVILCYGMNDAIYQPFAVSRFAAFQTGMNAAHEQILAAGAKVIHVTPPVYDPVAGRGNRLAADDDQANRFLEYNGVLDRYAEWLVTQRAAGWAVVDLHAAMNRWLAEQRRSNDRFTFSKDGVHPDANGHWFMAREILQFLGTEDIAAVKSAAAILPESSQGEKLLQLVEKKQELLRDAWLTETEHRRPGVKAGLPLSKAQLQADELAQQIRQLVKPDAVSEMALFPGQKSLWKGFDRYDFEANGKPATVVVPPWALPGKPWIWRGEFFGAFVEADIALVERGFHLAYLRVPDLFGSPKAVGYWNDFYKLLTEKYGFAKKVTLVGLSRGGLYCYNWAIANPDKVACIYADAPVCDFKSWPGGALNGNGTKNDTSREWAKLLRAYGFASDAEARAYSGNPVDNLKPLADANIPLLHVYGDADIIVPWPENTGIVAERYRKLGGSITLIAKPGIGHHPHGLSDPTPVVEFIIKHAAAGQ